MLTVRRLALVFSLILSVFLVACGTNADGGGNAESVDLSQSVSYEDELGGTTSISFPDGWVSNTEGAIYLASSEELLAQMDSSDLPDPASGQVLATAIVIPAEIAAVFVPDGEEPSATAIANSFIADMAEEGDTVNELEETTINDKTATVITATSEGVDLVLIAIELEEGVYAIVLGGTVAGEGSSIRPTIEAMAGTLSYTAGEAEESDQ